jgi:hypothetical protein
MSSEVDVNTKVANPPQGLDLDTFIDDVRCGRGSPPVLTG